MAPGPGDIPVSCACLMILDGWGMAPPGPGNAIALAATPVFDELWTSYPHASLTASGMAVGLPDGQMGNSEVGHLTIGAGAVVQQELTRINEATSNGELAANAVLRSALVASERVHVLGLASDGGVHSSLGHLHALLALAAELRVPDLVLHCFTDGRDTSPTSGAGFLEQVERWCAETGTGRVASVVGRFWAMDRDHRWERTQAAYDLLTHGRAGHRVGRAGDAALAAYAARKPTSSSPPPRSGMRG